ncbi:UNVERIFIED_CONTAM: Transmembrane emp24 domain-containing protein p24delta8 [Sesamum calycinum]|uniref:Transmembrane emp24 domain-containing protein p24delta8 n=1 Tax=Sesamum calycinum TaxID=2727403 RepID=A0AAW2LJ35_9LAMI
MACFFAADHKPPTSLTIDFDWKSGVAAKDWTNVAKKGRPGRSDHPNCLPVHKMGWVKEETWKVSKELLGLVVRMLMELELKKMFDVVQSIHDEMYYLRAREEEMQQLNRSTNNKMFWFSFLSILVCLSVAGLQLWHLKSFFEKKKLI